MVEQPCGTSPDSELLPLLTNLGPCDFKAF